jgi:hypothetical protein
MGEVEVDVRPLFTNRASSFTSGHIKGTVQHLSALHLSVQHLSAQRLSAQHLSAYYTSIQHPK